MSDAFVGEVVVTTGWRACSGWEVALFCLVALSIIWPASGWSQEGNSPAADDQGEYDALLELLDDLPRDQEVDALQDYLQRHPESVFRHEIEQRLELLEQTDLSVAGSRGGERRTVSGAVHRPFAFDPVGTTQRFNARMGLGGPGWAELLLGYDQPIDERWSAGGRFGFYEGEKCLEATGRFVVLNTPRNDGLLEASFTTRGALGLDSHLQIEPRVGYSGEFGAVQVTTFVGWRMRVTGGVYTRLLAGMAAGVALRDDLWLGLETSGRLNFLTAERPDLAVPEPTPYLVSFFALTAGVRYTIEPGIDVDITLSVPDWYRYQRLYAGAIGVGFWYRFGVDPGKPTR